MAAGREAWRAVRDLGDPACPAMLPDHVEDMSDTKQSSTYTVLAPTGHPGARRWYSTESNKQQQQSGATQLSRMPFGHTKAPAAIHLQPRGVLSCGAAMDYTGKEQALHRVKVSK